VHYAPLPQQAVERATMLLQGITYDKVAILK
jgi:hypothetical protein